MSIFNFRKKEQELERKIDILANIVGRNKLIAPAENDINDVMATAKRLGVTYKIFGDDDIAFNRKELGIDANQIEKTRIRK